MKRHAALMALALAACPPQPQPMGEDDAGEPARVTFDGPTQSGGVPTLPEDFVFDASIPAIDSGVIVVDRTCCSTNFSITDEEPPVSVDGVLRIDLNAFPTGIPLARSNGRWRATACFPVNASATYAYLFSWDGGLVDAGQAELDDGGVITREFVDLRFVQRASAEEPSVEFVDGTRANVFRAVTNCDGLDGSVPP